jgi:four helix bundle protein
MQDHRNLTIWRNGIDLVKDFYTLTSGFPKSEEETLVLPIRRLAIAIPSKIAAGVGRRSDEDFYQFLQIAIGHIFELDTYIRLSLELNYISDKDFDSISLKLEKERVMITFFMEKLQ